jgi:hypothetical protein
MPFSHLHERWSHSSMCPLAAPSIPDFILVRNSMVSGGLKNVFKIRISTVGSFSNDLQLSGTCSTTVLVRPGNFRGNIRSNHTGLRATWRRICQSRGQKLSSVDFKEEKISFHDIRKNTTSKGDTKEKGTITSLKVSIIYIAA